MAGRHLEFLWLARPISGQANVTATCRSHPMLDVIMLAIGIGSFALLLGYVALCERL
jgi:hypothetical protein